MVSRLPPRKAKLPASPRMARGIATIMGGYDVIRKILGAALMTTALMTGVAHAKDTIVWWDFLSGGDGVRMKAMLDEFNKEHAGTVEIQASTFEWGVPFYSKVQSAAAVGQGPDVMKIGRAHV